MFDGIFWYSVKKALEIDSRENNAQKMAKRITRELMLVQGMTLCVGALLIAQNLIKMGYMGSCVLIPTWLILGAIHTWIIPLLVIPIHYCYEPVNK